MVKLRKETVEKLKSLKDYERETYDDVISKMVAVRIGELNREDIKNIEEGLADLKAGRVFSSEDAAARLGIKRN
jgi:predicted transcriptional regulator